jgi:hypothetical protein
MPPSRTLPPVVARHGTSPNHAARSRALPKSSTSPTAAVSAVALSADARDRCQPPGRRRVQRRLHELPIKRGDARVELGPLAAHLLEKRQFPGAQAGPRVFNQNPDREAEGQGPSPP